MLPGCMRVVGLVAVAGSRLLVGTCGQPVARGGGRGAINIGLGSNAVATSSTSVAVYATACTAACDSAIFGFIVASATASVTTYVYAAIVVAG